MFLSTKFKGTFNSWDQMKIDDLELLTIVAPEVKDGPLICTTSSKDPKSCQPVNMFVFLLGPTWLIEQSKASFFNTCQNDQMKVNLKQKEHWGMRKGTWVW